MRYLIEYLACFVVVLFVASTSDCWLSRRKSDCNKLKDRIVSWNPQTRCGDHISKIGSRSSGAIGKNRIIGGTPTYPGQFPYSVRVHVDSKDEKGFEVGGVIIGEYWILTAASALQTDDDNTMSEEYGAKYITFGDYNNIMGNNEARSVKIRQVEKHPEFNWTSRENDLALLGLDERLDYSLNENAGGYGAVVDVCLPTKNVKSIDETLQESWFISGWGFNGSNIQSDTPEYYRIKQVDYSYCTSSLPNKIKFNPVNQICTYTEGKGVGLGDPGNGVVRLSKDGRFELVGILSLPFYGSAQAHVTILANVFHYLDWINHYLVKSNRYERDDELSPIDSNDQ